jgi:Uma2 family endonuclease
MSTTAISLDEYLNTTYEPDRDFVDGVVLERHLGTQRHSILQALLTIFFGHFRKSHGLVVMPEARLVVDAATGRHRIPDVMVVELPYTKGRVVVDLPAIVVEIKSPDDTFDDIIDRCFDYQTLGVPNIIVMDPDNYRAWRFYRGGLQILSNEPIRLGGFRKEVDIEFPFDQLFRELDE